jgi:ABC-2 type transport system permease protein
VLRMLVARELKRKYATSYLGYVWTLLEPAMMIAVYWLVWGHVARLGISNYVMFIAAGMLPWLWFRSSVTASTDVLTSNSRLVSSVSLPREMYPLSMVLTKSVEFLLTLPIVVALAAIYGMPPTHYLFYLPLVIVLELILCVGLALLLSALTTLFIDLERALTVFMRLLFYLTPVIYPTARLHGSIRAVYVLNPLVGIIELHRAIWFPNTVIDAKIVLISVVGSLLAFVGGWAAFIKLEPAVLKEL